jgi:hypothetical protein
MQTLSRPLAVVCRPLLLPGRLRAAVLTSSSGSGSCSSHLLQHASSSPSTGTICAVAIQFDVAGNVGHCAGVIQSQQAKRSRLCRRAVCPERTPRLDPDPPCKQRASHVKPYLLLLACSPAGLLLCICPTTRRRLLLLLGPWGPRRSSSCITGNTMTPMRALPAGQHAPTQRGGIRTHLVLCWVGRWPALLLRLLLWCCHSPKLTSML